MSTTAELLAHCEAVRSAGADFPTLWNEVLKSHPLVIGPPVQAIRGGRVRLEVRLIDGRSLAFDSESSAMTVE